MFIVIKVQRHLLLKFGTNFFIPLKKTFCCEKHFCPNYNADNHFIVYYIFLNIAGLLDYHFWKLIAHFVTKSIRKNYIETWKSVSYMHFLNLIFGTFCWAEEEKNEIILKRIPKLNWKQSPKFCTFTKKIMKSNFFKNLKRKYNTNNQVISFRFFFLFFFNTIIIYLA